MSEQAVTLRDVVAAYNVQVDITIKFFTILQVVSFATAGFMWTVKPPVLHVPVLVGFVLFAIGNAVLIFQAYRAGMHIRKAIRNYRLAHAEQIPEEFAPMFQSYENYPAWQIVVIHLFTDVVAIAAIVAAP